MIKPNSPAGFSYFVTCYLSPAEGHDHQGSRSGGPRDTGTSGTDGQKENVRQSAIRRHEEETQPRHITHWRI